MKRSWFDPRHNRGEKHRGAYLVLYKKIGNKLHVWLLQICEAGINKQPFKHKLKDFSLQQLGATFKMKKISWACDCIFQKYVPTWFLITTFYVEDEKSTVLWLVDAK